jgi:hypothetical protein
METWTHVQMKIVNWSKWNCTKTVQNVFQVVKIIWAVVQKGLVCYIFFFLGGGAGGGEWSLRRKPWSWSKIWPSITSSRRLIKLTRTSKVWSYHFVKNMIESQKLPMAFFPYEIRLKKRHRYIRQSGQFQNF